MPFVMRPLIDIADRRNLFRIALFLIGAILALSALALSAHAAKSRVLIIPPDDGYGFGECLTGKSACGEIVADALTPRRLSAARRILNPPPAKNGRKTSDPAHFSLPAATRFELF
jgi:hypothetical protein